jgi:hypothetical protein
MFGRAVHHIHRPCTVVDGKLVPYTFKGSEQFCVKHKDRLLEVKMTEDGIFDPDCGKWVPHLFTGELVWYVGGHVDVVGRFENGVLKETKEWSGVQSE